MRQSCGFTGLFDAGRCSANGFRGIIVLEVKGALPFADLIVLLYLAPVKKLKNASSVGYEVLASSLMALRNHLVSLKFGLHLPAFVDLNPVTDKTQSPCSRDITLY
jgi:hypothetical protein